MIKNTAKLNEEFNKFFEMTSAEWSFGNSILYKMCEEYPLHVDADVIVGKIWIIGRSYAAAIERRKNAVEFEGDFYHGLVAPSMLKIGHELDFQIQELLKETAINRQNLPKVLHVHKFLVDTFTKISGLEKRSLASKYLHFHCPKMFYIYDSRANTRLNSIVKMDLTEAKPLNNQYDNEYSHFCIRMLELQNYILQTYGKTLSPRELDNFLLYSW